MATVILFGACATEGPLLPDNTNTENEPRNPNLLVEPPECNLGRRVPSAEQIREACSEIQTVALSAVDNPVVDARPGPPRLTVTADGRLRYEVTRIENGLLENLVVLYRRRFQFSEWTEVPSGDPMVLRYRGRQPGHQWDYEAVVRFSQDPSVRTLPYSPVRLENTLETLEAVVPPEARVSTNARR